MKPALLKGGECVCERNSCLLLQGSLVVWSSRTSILKGFRLTCFQMERKKENQKVSFLSLTGNDMVARWSALLPHSRR